MNHDECQTFHDRLDDLVSGALPHEGQRQLRAHAERCPTCAMALQVREHLATLSAEKAEAAVPDDWVRSMWPRLQERFRVRSTRPRPMGWRRRELAGPVAVAAAVVLLLGVGFLSHKVRALQLRADVLVQQLEQRERWLAELDSSPNASARARTAALAASADWERLLVRRERVTVAEVEAALGQLPPGTTILRAAQLRRLARRVTYGSAGELEAGLRSVDVEDGLQAEELLTLLEEWDLDPARSVATSRIFSWLGANRGIERL